MMKKKKKDVSVNLNCYTIRFREKYIGKNAEGEFDYFPLSNVFNCDFKEVFKKFIKSIDTKSYVNKSDTRILYPGKILSVSQSTFSGTIRKGHSGQESYIDERRKGKAVTVSRVKTDQFNSIPFYYLLCQPSINSKGIIFISQSYKQFGFKEVFEDAFEEFFHEEFDKERNYKCEFSNLSIAPLFEKYVNEGSIRKLRFRKHGLTKNLEDILNTEDKIDKNNFEVELSIKARRKGFMGIKSKIISKEASFIELSPIEGYEYEEAFADVSFGGRLRAINITRPDNFSASFDVTRDSGLEKETNHPNFDKLYRVAREILDKEILPFINL